MRDIGCNRVIKETKWETTCFSIKKMLTLTDEQAKVLASSTTGQFLYKLPFIATCSNPERTALINLTLFAVDVFSLHEPFLSCANHSPSDDKDIFNRLRPFMSYSEGNEKVLKHGTALLALIMLCGYERSRDKDSLDGVYNPLNSGAWDFAEKKRELLSIIQDNFCSEVDKELSIEKAMLRGW